MMYSLNLSTPLVLRLIHLGENAEEIDFLTESQRDSLRRLAAELRRRLEDLR